MIPQALEVLGKLTVSVVNYSSNRSSGSSRFKKTGNIAVAFVFALSANVARNHLTEIGRDDNPMHRFWSQQPRCPYHPLNFHIAGIPET